jgi:hypothetical protein
MPDIRDGVPADPQPAALPASLVPDPLDQAARKVASVGRSVEHQVAIVWLDDAKAARDQAVRQATKRTMDELERVSARLIEANEDLEAWGAFDYLLLAMAEALGVETSDEEEPLALVERLISKSYAEGRAEGVRSAHASEGRM